MGEEIFKRYLEEHSLTFEYEKATPGKTKKPDFTLTIGEQEYLFEVKDCTSSELDGTLHEPYSWIRRQIDEGRQKFKEFRGLPCSVVMFATRGWGTVLRNPDFVFGAMYGDFGIQVPIGPGTSEAAATGVFLRGGRMIQPHWRKAQNTTISALVTLREIGIGQARLQNFLRSNCDGEDFAWMADIQSRVDFDIGERRLGLIVWENAYAAVPLDRHLFRGPFDERWGMDGDALRRVFVGDGLAEYYSGVKPA